MKIAVISSTVFCVPLSQYGGLEQIAWNCARELAERGHNVSLIAPDGSWCPGVTVLGTGPAGGHDEKTAYSKYWQYLKNMDCIVDHSWSKFAYIGKLEGWLTAPVLGVLHAPVNTMYQSLPAVNKPCFVCISEDQRKHFEALFNKPARVCYNGIDLKYYRPIEGMGRTDRFLFLARFSSIKGADLAIESCRRVGVNLDLVGDSSITNEPEYLAKIKSMCDGKNIRMVGPASRGETVWWYSRAKALLHPNERFREPFGLAPVEALACGCPVIAWDYGAMSETVGDRVGMLVKDHQGLDAAIVSVRDDLIWGSDETRKRCINWAAGFSVQKMGNRYHELVTEALRGGW